MAESFAEAPPSNGKSSGTKKQAHNSNSKMKESLESFTLGAEVEEGNVEYKWRLVNVDTERFEQLVSQLKWRLLEGQGEAIYEIGVEDNGFMKGLLPAELKESLETLERMAARLNAHVSILCEREGKEGKVIEALVREVREESNYIDVRVAVCGNVDSGKSTLVGVLTKGKLDDGRGSSRIGVFNHKHEVETGRTSSISHKIMGFDSKGKIVNYTSLKELSWGDIIEQSCKVMTFFDLAGHERYLKTTVAGMTGHLPDYALLLVGANMGVTRMTKEHLGLALALKIPVIILVTKIDMCPPNVHQQTLEALSRILKMRGVRKISIKVKSERDVVTCAKNIHNDQIVPLFEISSVTGANLDLLKKFLNLLPPRMEWHKHIDKQPEVLIDETYFVPGVGTVVGGTVMSGIVSCNDTFLLGPDGNGNFRQVQVKTIHSKRVPVRQVSAGMTAGFAVKKIKRSEIRKGMVLAHPMLKPKATWEFEAEVVVLYHSTTIKCNYQPVVQCLTMRQSAKIIKMDRELLRTGDRATVRFRFMYRPEYVKPGLRLIFREGKTKGMGIISAVLNS